MARTDEGTLSIELVHAWPERYWSMRLTLPADACVGDALAIAGPALAAAGLALESLGLAVFGRSATPATRLRDGDRVELLRPLLASPRQARASRAMAAKKRGG